MPLLQDKTGTKIREANIESTSLVERRLQIDLSTKFTDRLFYYVESKSRSFATFGSTKEHAEDLWQVLLADSHPVIRKSDLDFVLIDVGFDADKTFRLLAVLVLDGIGDQVLEDDGQAIDVAVDRCLAMDPYFFFYPVESFQVF